MFLFTGGEQLVVTRANRMSVTRSMAQLVEEEVNKAINDSAENITADNCEAIFSHKVYRTRITWGIVCCNVCHRPNLVHADPWSEDCILEPVNQTYKAELMDFMKNNKRIQQLAESFEPEEEDEIQEERVPRTPRIPRNRSGTNQPQDKLKFPIWKENLSWSEYEPMITWYRETSTKEVKTQFMELINALNSSD